MQVGNRLPAVIADVGHESIPGPGDFQLPGQIPHRPEHPGAQVAVRIGHPIQRRDMASGNDEHVDRSLGRDVPEGDDLVILEDRLSGDLSSGDLAEDTVCGHLGTSLT